jgi:hypothetical protein
MAAGSSEKDRRSKEGQAVKGKAEADMAQDLNEECGGGNGRPRQANADRDIFELVKADLSTDLLILLGGDLDKRNQLGWRHHAKQMQAFDGRDSLRDAYEEALDEIPYLRKAMVERDNPDWLVTMYHRAVQHAAQLKLRLGEEVKG